MIVVKCPNCGGPVSVFAKSCARCGAPNGARWRALGLAATLLVLVVLGGVVAALAPRWWPASSGTGQPTDDFAWLRKAMTDCDNDAAKEPGKVSFLVIPLASKPEQVQQWRERSLNDIGNAILLRSDAALEGLRERSLTLSNAQYVFGMRDQAGTIYRWNPSTGIARFSTTELDSAQSFQVQFLVGGNPRESEWGRGFIRQRGNCYWVNAIIGQ